MIGETDQPGWKKVILRDICEKVDYGYTASATKERVGPRFLRITDIVPDLIDWDSVTYCEIDPKNLQKYGLQEGDIVIARTGATTGYAKRIKRNLESVFASYLVRVRIAEEYDNRYVGLIIESGEYKRFIKANLGGAAQPQANAQVLTSFPMSLPPLPIQRKIASVLSAYDDLIENNTRRIEILEEMAQRIYREWFVHFRFPGHEKVGMVNSPLGQIPEGWEIRQLGDVANVQWGDTSTTKASYVDEGFDAYSASGLDGKLDHYDFDREGVVLSAIGARCGRTWYADGKWSCIKNTIRFWANSKSVSTEFLFFSTLDPNSWPRRGAAQPFISLGDARNVTVLCPQRTLIDTFTDVASSHLSMISLLKSKNINLRHTRDLLLPKLISGEVDVEDAGTQSELDGVRASS